MRDSLFVLLYSDLHGSLIGTPDDGAEVSDAQTVADELDVFMALLLDERRGDIAGGGNDGVARDLDGGAVLCRTDNGAVFDLAERRFQIDGHLLPREPLAQIRAVGQAHALLGHQIVLHLDDRDVFALQRQLIRDLAAGQTAAHDGNLFTHRCAQQIFTGLEHLLVAGNLFEHARGRAGGDDDGVSAEGRDLFDLGVQADLHAELFHLLYKREETGMASEEQYLDDLLKSMMDNKPDSMEDAMQDMNKAENKPSDFSTEDLNSMLDELEHTEPDRPADMAEDSEEPEEVVDAGEEEIIGAPVEEPIEKPEEPVIDVEPDELIEEPEESKAEPVSEAAFENTEKKMNQEIAEVSQDENTDDSGWKPVESVETTGDEAEPEPKEAWKSDLDDLLMSMKDQDGEQEPEPQEVEEKSAENHTADENRQPGKDQSEEDVLGGNAGRAHRAHGGSDRLCEPRH